MSHYDIPIENLFYKIFIIIENTLSQFILTAIFSWIFLCIPFCLNYKNELSVKILY